MTISVSSLTPLITSSQGQSNHYVTTRVVESNLGVTRGATASFRDSVTASQPLARGNSSQVNTAA